jgi:hypothetical protein
MTEIFPDKAVMNAAIERVEMEAVELRKENAALYEQREALILQAVSPQRRCGRSPTR